MGQATIQLDRIKVINRREELGKDEAYLWVIGLQILQPHSNTAGREFVLLTNPEPGNLGGGFSRGEARAVPASVGKLSYPVSPLGSLRFGVVVVAWEHDRTAPATIRNAYSSAAGYIDDFIREIIDSRLAEGPNPKTLEFRPVSADEVEGLRSKVKARIRDLFLGAMSIGRPWTLNYDDFIGADSLVVESKGNGPFEQDFTLDLRKHDHIGAHYQVTGTLRYTP